MLLSLSHEGSTPDFQVTASGSPGFPQDIKVLAERPGSEYKFDPSFPSDGTSA